MSNVTNVMLSDDSLWNEKLKQMIEDVLGLVMIAKDGVGGTKCLEANVYFGAFNYFDLNKFKERMRVIYERVQLDDDVQLLVKTQDSCRWEEVDWVKP